MGERQGQRVPPSGPVGGMPPNVGAGVGVGVGGRPDAQAMLVQQNREMEALERRSQRERSGSMNHAQVRRVARKNCSVWSDPFVFAQRQLQPPQRHDEEDSAEELEHISTRTLALTRYRRNHELMNEVFTYASLGQFSHRSQRDPAWPPSTGLRSHSFALSQGTNDLQNPQHRILFSTGPNWKIARYVSFPLS